MNNWWLDHKCTECIYGTSDCDYQEKAMVPADRRACSIIHFKDESLPDEQEAQS